MAFLHPGPKHLLGADEGYRSDCMSCAFSMRRWTDPFEWTARKCGFASSNRSAASCMFLSTDNRSSPHAVDASQSGLSSCNGTAGRPVARPPTLLPDTDPPQSSLEASTSPSFSSACTLNSRTSESLKASCSRCIFFARSWTTCRCSLNSKSSIYLSKSRSSTNLMSCAASSSSKPSFSFWVIAHKGFLLPADGFKMASTSAGSMLLRSLSLFILRMASRCCLNACCILSLRCSWACEISSAFRWSSFTCSCNSLIHWQCRRKAALGPRVLTSNFGSERFGGGRPSCSPTAAAMVDLKGGCWVPWCPEAFSSGRLQSMTPL
mmetsp:Transcript_128686/g.321012  ORF Transcript_128686/g.321012 Transcript_128686/m.321012 type:complete len:321 (+) Transcript_128686:64-1026(+)